MQASSNRSPWRVIASSLILSVPLVLLPLAGPVAATWLGGRRGRGNAVVAAVIVAGLWGTALRLLSNHEISVGDTRVSLGPIALLIPLLCGGFLAGGLFAAGGRIAVSLGLVVLLAGVIWSAGELQPVLSLIRQLQPQPHVTETSGPVCPENLKKLYTAAMLYADSWDGKLPPADRWEDALKETLADPNAVNCPAVSGGSHGYAMNAELGGKRIADIKDPASVPLFFDADLPGPNAHGSLENLPRPGRHGGRNTVIYADGQTKSVAP